MRIVKNVAVALLLASAALEGIAGIREGYQAYQNKDYLTADREFRPLAIAGDSEAQLAMHFLYSDMRDDPSKAKEALYWLQSAAANGNAAAQGLLGIRYSYGDRLLPKNMPEAVRLLKSAAEQNDPVALTNLGVMYSTGSGVPQDYLQAAQYLRRASAQGSELAIYNLGLAYLAGEGVGQSKIVAYALFNMVASGSSAGSKGALEHRDWLAKTLSMTDKVAGQALTRALARPGQFLATLDGYTKGGAHSITAPK